MFFRLLKVNDETIDLAKCFLIICSHVQMSEFEMKMSPSQQGHKNCWWMCYIGQMEAMSLTLYALMNEPSWAVSIILGKLKRYASNSCCFPTCWSNFVKQEFINYFVNKNPMHVVPPVAFFRIPRAILFDAHILGFISLY